MACKLIASVAASISVTSMASAQEWVSTGGPAGGDVIALDVVGSVGVAASNLGLHTSADGGVTWTRQFRSESAPAARFGFVGVTPAAAFAQNSAMEFFRSVDGGVSWTQTPLPAPGAQVTAIESGNGRIFMLVAPTGSAPNFFVSADAGLTWAAVESFPGEATGLFVAGDEVMTSIQVVRDFGFTVVSTCYRSTDAGDTWTAIAGGDGAIAGVPGTECGPGQRVAGAILAGRHVSQDNGQTWTFFQPTFSLAEAICKSHCEFRQPSVVPLSDGLYVHAYLDFLDQDEPADNFKLWRTSDFVNWTEVPVSDTLPDLLVGQSSWREDGDRLFIAGTLGVYRSEDRGTTWVSSNSGIGASMIWAMASVGGSLVCNVVNTNYVARLEPDRFGWSDHHIFDNGAFFGTVLELFAPDDQTLLAGHLIDGITRSDDGGVDWDWSRTGVPQYNGTAGLQYTEIEAFAKSGSSLFAGSGEGLEFRSDGGQGFVHVGRGILRSSDNGRTWTRVNNGLRVIGRNSFFEPQFDPIVSMGTQGSVVLAGGLFLGVARSTNNGASWSYSNSGLPMISPLVPASAINVLVSANDAIYLGMNGVDQNAFPGVGSVFKSTDGGVSWTPAAAGLPAGVPIIAIAEHDGALFAGTAIRNFTVPPFAVADFGVFRSDDQGATWSRSGVALSGVAVRELEVHDGDLYAGTDHLGVWRLDDGPACPADFNADSVVNSQDFFDYLAAFFAAAPGADFNGDRTVNSQDFFDFLAAFFEIC